MDARPESDSSRPEARRAVGRAIQNLMAARLGRAFIPLALLFGWGCAILYGGGAVWVALGALLTSGAIMAHGLRIVQLALGRPRRAWMSVAAAAALVPPVYGTFLLGWEGLRALATATDAGTLVPAVLFVVLGLWVLRNWVKIVEIHRLARTMAITQVEDGGGA